jgi:hypothetical protein
MEAALRLGADWVWVMDDDGRPEGEDCLATLLSAAERRGAAMAAPLVLDVENPARLSFPVRVRGRTLFEAEPVRRHGEIEGFAHLFNGALIAAALLRRIGLPDPRFVIRGDEVEFLYRARRAGRAIVLATGTAFLHPGSAAEIHPILGGAYYATLPWMRASSSTSSATAPGSSGTTACGDGWRRMSCATAACTCWSGGIHAASRAGPARRSPGCAAASCGRRRATAARPGPEPLRLRP